MVLITIYVLFNVEQCAEQNEWIASVATPRPSNCFPASFVEWFLIYGSSMLLLRYCFSRWLCMCERMLRTLRSLVSFQKGLHS